MIFKSEDVGGISSPSFELKAIEETSQRNWIIILLNKLFSH